VAGNGEIYSGAGGSSDLGDNGPATSALLSSPRGVAVDASGNLYIADLGDDRVRKVSNGVITTVAGHGRLSVGDIGDNGPATGAAVKYPRGVAVDAAGNLYIADVGNGRIRKVSNGVITTVAGGGTSRLGDNGPATSAALALPTGVAVDASGNLYIADDRRIRKVTNGVITTVAGADGPLGDNGPATSALLLGAAAVAVDAVGNVYIAEIDNNRIRFLTCCSSVPTYTIQGFAGNGTYGYSGDGGPAASAELSFPTAVAVDASGNVYIADYENNRIRKVSNGVITTVAGSWGGGSSYRGDGGPATSAVLDGPWGVAVDAAGTLYIAENTRIRMVSNGVIATVAGGGSSLDNGPATSAWLKTPSGVAVDAAGDLYIADSGHNRICKVSNGVITTVAGGGTSGLGDNGPATGAALAFPSDVAVDAAGNLYIADSGNKRIRKVSNGVITTVAGKDGTNGYSGDNGLATSAELSFPEGVAVDAAGNLYIADASNATIRMVTNGVIRPVAGRNIACFDWGASCGDGGPATSAYLNSPTGVAVDASGKIYIADAFNRRIRVLTPSAAPCSYALSAGGQTIASAGGSGLVAVTASGGCSWVALNPLSWVTLTGSTSGTGNGAVAFSVAANPGDRKSVV
jgi:sugar lactone lactonase YvrE